MANGHGGKRPGAGAKKKAFTLLKERIESEKQSDAEYAFSLYAEVMRDASQPLKLRLECAEWVSNRILGKPKEKHEIAGEDGKPIQYQIEYVNDWRESASHVDVDVTRS